MITECKSHKQVMIKVNAECDENIAPIVLALNEINGIVTLDSCLIFYILVKNNTWQNTIGYIDVIRFC